MNSLISGIESVVQNAITEYIQKISAAYEQVDEKKLMEIWNETSTTVKISLNTTRGPAMGGMKVNNKVQTLCNQNPRKVENSGDRCPYRFIKRCKERSKLWGKT